MKKFIIILSSLLLAIILFFSFGCHKRLYARAIVGAIEACDDARLEKLLSLNGDVNAVPHIKLIALWFEQFNYPPLLLACERGNDKAVALLLQHGADPNLSCEGRTALIIACSSYQENRNEIISLLLEAEADVTFVDSYGSTALDYFETTRTVGNFDDEQTEQVWQQLKMRSNGDSETNDKISPAGRAVRRGRCPHRPVCRHYRITL